MSLPERRNLFGLPLLGLQLTDIVLLGGVAWLLLSNRGQALLALLGKLFPEPEQYTPTRGGAGGTQLPSQATFQSFRGEASPVLAAPGATVSLTIKFDHIGRGGSYVAGAEPSGWTFFWNSYNPPPVEVDCPVSDDASWTSYTVNMRLPLRGAEYASSPWLQPLSYDIRYYLRDRSGRIVAEKKVQQAVRVAPR